MNSEVLIKFKADTTDADSKTNKFADSISGLTSKFALANIAAEAFTYTIGVIKNGLDDAITRVDTLNNFPRVMSNLGISAEDSAEVIEDLSERLKGLPTTLNDAAASVQRLTSKNGDIKKSEEIFLAMNNAILAGGANAQTQASAIEQLSQAYAKGKPDMMEWRTMMTAMPAQLKQVAIAMGYVDADALGEALREGSVSMDDFMNTLIRLNQQGENGFLSLDEQARNATGGIQTNITNMKTAFTRGIADIVVSVDEALEPFGGISGVITTIGKVGEEVFKTIGDVIKDIMPDLIEFGKKIFPTIKKAVQTLLPVIQKLAKSLLPALGKIVDKLLPPLIRIIDKVLPAVSKMIDSLIPLLDPLIDALLAILDVQLALIEPLIEVLSYILPPIVDILSTLLQVILPPLTTLFEIIAGVIRGVIGQIKEWLSGTMEAISTIAGAIAGGWQNIGENLKKPFSVAFEFIGGIFNGFINTIKTIGSTIGNIFGTAWETVKNGAQTAWNGITGIFGGFASFFANILGMAWANVKSVFKMGGNIFNTIVDGVLSGFKTAVNWLIDGINSVISIPFNGINAALSSIKNVSILGKKPFYGLVNTVGIPEIPHLNVGTNEVPEDMLAMIHKGEAVVPKKFNPYTQPSGNLLGMMNNPIKQVVIVNANFKQNALGQTVRDIKTFSGGARNDYNYGM